MHSIRKYDQNCKVLNLSLIKKNTHVLTLPIFNEHRLRLPTPPITVSIILYTTYLNIDYRLLFQSLFNADSIIMLNLMWIVQKPNEPKTATESRKFDKKISRSPRLLYETLLFRSDWWHFTVSETCVTQNVPIIHETSSHSFIL